MHVFLHMLFLEGRKELNTTCSLWIWKSWWPAHLVQQRLACSLPMWWDRDGFMCDPGLVSVAQMGLVSQCWLWCVPAEVAFFISMALHQFPDSPGFTNTSYDSFHSENYTWVLQCILYVVHRACGVTPAAHGVDMLLALSIPTGSDTPCPLTQPGWL